MKTKEEIEAFLGHMAERASQNGASHSGMHRVAFTAVQPLVEGVLARGYTMKATWDALREQKKLSMSYETFRAHCRRAGIGRPGRVPRRGDLN
jgi:Family of unknown function (DUF5338)